MIGVTFQVPELDFSTRVIPMAFVPRIGDQVFMSDFINEEEEAKIFENNENPEIDGLFVTNVTWFRSPKEKELYVLIILEKK